MTTDARQQFEKAARKLGVEVVRVTQACNPYDYEEGQTEWEIWQAGRLSGLQQAAEIAERWGSNEISRQQLAAAIRAKITEVTGEKR